jgi:hypothetical protein
MIKKYIRQGLFWVITLMPLAAFSQQYETPQHEFSEQLSTFLENYEFKLNEFFPDLDFSEETQTVNIKALFKIKNDLNEQIQEFHAQIINEHQDTHTIDKWASAWQKCREVDALICAFHDMVFQIRISWLHHEYRTQFPQTINGLIEYIIFMIEKEIAVIQQLANLNTRKKALEHILAIIISEADQTEAAQAAPIHNETEPAAVINGHPFINWIQVNDHGTLIWPSLT